MGETVPNSGSRPGPSGGAETRESSPCTNLGGRTYSPRGTALAGCCTASGVTEIERQGTEIRKDMVSFPKHLGPGP